MLMLGEHTSWNNAQPGTLVPILSSLYRTGSPFEGPWRPWDFEIIAIETDNTPEIISTPPKSCWPVSVSPSTR